MKEVEEQLADKCAEDNVTKINDELSDLNNVVRVQGESPDKVFQVYSVYLVLLQNFLIWLKMVSKMQYVHFFIKKNIIFVDSCQKGAY